MSCVKLNAPFTSRVYQALNAMAVLMAAPRPGLPPRPGTQNTHGLEGRTNCFSTSRSAKPRGIGASICCNSFIAGAGHAISAGRKAALPGSHGSIRPGPESVAPRSGEAFLGCEAWEEFLAFAAAGCFLRTGFPGQSIASEAPSRSSPPSPGGLAPLGGIVWPPGHGKWSRGTRPFQIR